MKGCEFYILFYVTVLIKNAQSTSPQIVPDQQETPELPPCKACNVFLDSLRRTEERAISKGLGKEPDVSSVLGNVCSDVTRGQKQCYELLNQNPDDIIKYWRSEEPSLFEVLCIEKLKVCCPPDRYGPKCEKCRDCHKNGKCKGGGTRKGNGKCSCNPGYTGEECRVCAVSYYESFRDESKLLCSKCHDACWEDGCTTAGPKGCRSCRAGWRMDPNYGCTDLNECLQSRNICTAQQFCVNNDGSYSCLECDRSCIGCDGDGPDMCKSCAEGFSLIEGKCTDDSLEQREQYINMTRFLTYFGLCVATCVIFQSSTTKAYMVGAAVATYIAASEYWLKTTPAPADLKSQLNSKKLEDLIMNLL